MALAISGAIESTVKLSNLFSSSIKNSWKVSGCSLSGSSNCDYINEYSNFEKIDSFQNFKTGEEDLLIDVTKIIIS